MFFELGFNERVGLHLVMGDPLKRILDGKALGYKPIIDIKIVE